MLRPGERMAGPERRAPALEPLDARLQLGDLLFAQRRRLRRVELGRLEAQPLSYRAQLLLRLLQLVMNALCLHLRLRHELAGLPQRALQLRLLARTRAQLARHLLAGAATARELALLARVRRGAHALERVLDHAARPLLGLGGHALHAGEPLALVALGEQPPDSLPYHAPHVLPGLRPHAPGARLLDHLIRPRAR